MRVFPILLDSRPAYLESDHFASSLLLAPLGTGTLLGHLQSQLGAVSEDAPLIVPTFAPDARYEEAVHAVLPLATVIPLPALGAHLEGYEPSDRLLVADPRCFPAAGFEPAAWLDGAEDDPRWVKHVVAMEATCAGTDEGVQLDAQGRVRRIQRFYDGVTWPLCCGVACSILPVACAQLARDLPFHSLTDLRQSLAIWGVPSRDIPMPVGAFDLTEEQGFLGLSERFILDLASRRGTEGKRAPGEGLHRGAGSQIHSLARVLGPVVFMDGVVVEEGATLLGPTLVGKHSRVGRGAVVAQCVLAPWTVIPSNTSIRHRVLFGTNGNPASRPISEALTNNYAGERAVHRSAPLALREDAPRSSAYTWIKPWWEGLAALLGLLLLSPLLALIAALIKLDSPGPVLYGDDREYKDGRPFRCWKFRTMVVGAHTQQRRLAAKNQMDGPQFKLDRDPRVTSVGHWLRIFSLDELPQLINVVRAEMSLVGPRPSPFRENQVCIPWRQGRLSVRPGITGLWQVCRHDRNLGDFHQWIHYDLLYVRHLSFLTDLRILLATVITLGGRRHVPLSWIIPARKLQGRGVAVEVELEVVVVAVQLLGVAAG